jgi:Uma2 family endonuclease
MGLVEDYLFPVIVRTRAVPELSEDQFFELCQINDALCIERTATGDWSIMPLEGGETSIRKAEITMQLGLWAKDNGAGVVTAAWTGFRLPNTAIRAPDAAWTARPRLAQLSAEEWEKFPPLCPDFVLELRSPIDRLPVLQAKMEEYRVNGARLGWLLDPESHAVYVYRPDAPVERLDNPETLSGDPVLPGFVLNLREIW